MATEKKTRFSFADFTLDISLGRLLRGDEDVQLRAKSFQLLSHMAQNDGRVISKDELLSVLWPEIIVTEDSLTQCVHDVRRALGNHGPEILKTVPRRGYLFCVLPQAPSRTAASPESSVVVAGDNSQLGENHPSRPELREDGIAVLPFVPIGDLNPVDMNLLDGLAHDVISRLARLRTFHVIARGSTFALRHLASDPTAVGRSLRVAYAVAGTAQSVGTEIRIVFEIISVAEGSVLWTEDFREKREGFVDVVGRLTERIVQKVNVEVTAAEIRKALSVTGRPLDAWQAYHAGLHESQRFELARMPAALRRFEQAISLDPGFARAHAAQSFCHFLHAFIDHGEERPSKLSATLKAAEEAMRVDETNPSSQWAYGRALWLGGDPQGGLRHLRTAIGFSPSYALAHYFTGLIEAIHGEPETAIVHLDAGKDLSPFDPFVPSMEIMRAIALVRTGDLDAAVPFAKSAAQHRNAHPQILAPAAMILAEAEEMESARKIVHRIQEYSPDYKASQLQKTFYGMPDALSGFFKRNAPKLGI